MEPWNKKMNSALPLRILHSNKDSETDYVLGRREVKN